ncbi:MAG: helix-turn-helix domain-containing protein [Gammaproteobacteria bacterium]|nr:helix-turn-helix domain-containing protein [Gammaproteobacteria bacterium]NNF59861.1 helix-turn-helix domain-containing protein [Gammaproteobacteria bacterium]NNM21498.1 helix-turn-helix domain-containing protein [Gammaproteobacteria bacterium]
MADRTLLWVDLALQECADSTRHFAEFFRIRRSSAQLEADAAECPVAICFEYDFPDKAGLKLLQETKRLHPSLPVLMLTLQHSEDLAVWAFRARVWDYFVKPVDRRDVERCSESLLRIDHRRGDDRMSVRQIPPVPQETRLRRFTAGSQQALAPAVSYVQSHYADKIMQAQVAELCSMSSFSFSRQFHSAFGLTFQEYLLRYRVERAEELLLNPSVGVSDVAFATGFRDPSYFGRVFRRLRNMSPSQWRQHQMEDARPSLPAPTLIAM